MSQSIIKQYYDGLGKGKIIAAKCKSCGSHTFPPRSACEHCGGTDLEQIEISGRGKLLFVSHSIAPPPNPRLFDMAPYAYGHIELEEGIYVQAIITNIDIDPGELKKYFDAGPVDVEPDILTVKELPILAFKTV